MAKIWGEAERMQLELESSNPSAGLPGRVIYNTTDGKPKYDTGTIWKNFAGGAGAGTLNWYEFDSSPEYSVENNYPVYLFAPGSDIQALYTAIMVPSSYTSGQINLVIRAFAGASSNTVLLRSQATLTRAATDDVDSTTNQRTSTNSAITLTAPTNNTPLAITLDLTDSSSQINGVTVSAGDLIKVKLYRDTDTCTLDVNFLPFASEVTF